MSRTLCILAVLAALVVSACPAQEAALVKQLEAEQSRVWAERNKLRGQLTALRDRLGKEADLVDLRQAKDAAEAAHRKNEQTHPDLAVPRKAEQDAMKAYTAAAAAAGASDPTVRELQTEAAALTKQQSDADKQRRAIDASLQAIRRRIAGSAEARPLVAEVARLDKAARDLRQKDPELTAARKAWQQAENAYRKACEALPENRQRRDARKAYDAAVKAHEGVQAADAETQQARKALNDKVAELVAADAEALALAEKRKSAERSAEQSRKRLSVLRREIFAASRAAASKDPVAQEARKAQDAARKAYREAYARATGSTNKARYDARKAYEAKLAEKLKSDPQAAELNRQIETVDKQLAEVRRKIRAMTKPKARAPADSSE